MASQASLADLTGGRQQFLDLAGDGKLDLVDLTAQRPASTSAPTTEAGRRSAPFSRCPTSTGMTPTCSFVDLTGDGHADMLITEDEVFTWYPSLAEAGFGPATRVQQALDEEQGPRLVFADGTPVHLSWPTCPATG